jgi:predicted signal transduction protein with EAL and GGDEF domain
VRHDVLVLGTLIAAFVLLIANGTSLFREISMADRELGRGVGLAAVALTLNVALILFGWRRYVDLQHETERRLEGEHRAAIAASTDALTGLLNRKGFADRTDALRQSAVGSGGGPAAADRIRRSRFRSNWRLRNWPTGGSPSGSYAC